ncbi:MAG: AMP-binding protein, partial [Rhodospirillaceae bacterium]|nr:AMP-binding protein [Rhodospirillaceae bacterium]
MLPIDHLFRAAARWPERIAVDAPGERLSYRALAEQVAALAAAFQARDPDPEARIGICAHNTQTHLIAMLAVQAAGRCWVALNPRNGREELDGFIDLARPALIVADEDCLDRFTAPASGLILGATEGPSWATDTVAGLLSAHDGKRPAPAPNDLSRTAAVKLTGGSTGKPKAVMQSLRCWNAVTVNQILAIGLTSEDVTLLAAPITHGSGQYILPTLAVGGRLVLIDRPRPADILDAFEIRGETPGVSTVFLPPTMIYMLLAEPGAAERTYPALRHLIYAGAPMRAERIVEARAAFANAIETSYGQAEAPQIMAYQRAEDFADAANLSAVGFPTPLTRLAVMDAENRLLPRGETGEIVAAGDLLFSGYLENAEATAAVLQDGWLRTGDLGAFDETGRLFIRGRARDVIITGGFNVYPLEVEQVVLSHPAVQDCAVVGVPDETWGEAIKAVVELKAGQTVAGDELIALCKERIGSVKAPKSVDFVDDLPRSPVGKVTRKDVR